MVATKSNFEHHTSQTKHFCRLDLPHVPPVVQMLGDYMQSEGRIPYQDTAPWPQEGNDEV